MRTALAALFLLTTVALACGDGVIIVSVNSGTIVSSPLCDNGTGQFDMQNQGGLVVLVLIKSNTVIVNASGRPGRCTDLTLGAPVRVTGPQQGAQITAQSVDLE